MNFVFSGLNIVQILVYIDDVIAYNSSEKDHLRCLSEVLNRVRKANLRINPKKTKFALKKVKYIGHFISEDGIYPDPQKVELIKNQKAPSTVKQLRSFLGLVNYYRRYCKNFAQIFAPLRELLMKDVKFIWTKKHQISFEKLKDMLITTATLAFPDTSKDFYIYTDSSSTAISYILTQKDENNHEKVIEYNGRSLRPNEKHYSIQELEALSSVEATKLYHNYITNSHVYLVTDHFSNKFLQTMKLGKSRLQRWALHLMQYDLTILYKPGVLRTNADSISRMEFEDVPLVPKIDEIDDNWPPLIPPKEDKSQKIVEKEYCSIILKIDDKDDTINIITDDTLSAEDFASLQRSCPDFSPIIRYLETGELPDDEKLAKQVILQADQYAILNNTLRHLYIPRTKKRLTEI